MIEIYPRLFVGSEMDYEKAVRHQDGWWIIHACKRSHIIGNFWATEAVARPRSILSISWQSEGTVCS